MISKLRAKAGEWNVTIEETRETATSFLGFGVRSGIRVVLKLSKQPGDESHSGKVLRAFDGDGAVRVLESETDAVLLERLDPGESLATLVQRGNDDEATRILAHVIGKLAHHAAPVKSPTVSDWGNGFERYLKSGDEQIPQSLVHEAREQYQGLAATQHNTMLLHGDFQHYNVLFDNARGWVAIDPKGVVGELEYEIGPILRNPIELPELFGNPDTINRRVDAICTLLDLDRARVINWSFAQAVLSVIWDVEDGYRVEPHNHSLTLGLSLKLLRSEFKL